MAAAPPEKRKPSTKASRSTVTEIAKDFDLVAEGCVCASNRNEWLEDARHEGYVGRDKKYDRNEIASAHLRPLRKIQFIRRSANLSVQSSPSNLLDSGLTARRHISSGAPPTGRQPEQRGEQ